MRVVFASYVSENVIPLGVLSLAAVLRERGHDARLVEVPDSAALIGTLRRTKADVAGFSAPTGMHTIYRDWARDVKRALPGCVTLFGGPHPTFVPRLVEDDGVDAIVRGEAEETLPALLERIEGGLDDEPIPGVWHTLGASGGGSVVKGPLRPPPADLDALPEPAFDLVYDGFPNRGQYPVKSFLASRGCAYRCGYCANASTIALQGDAVPRIRCRTPRLVVEEIDRVRRRWPTGLVWLADASLLTKRRWATELLERIHRDVKLPHFCKVRPDHVTERAADLLQRTGCHAVGMGIESGSDRLRARVLGRTMDRETIVTACERLRARGIRVVSFNMFGIPTETLDEALATVDLNRECRVDYAEGMLLQPYPGTPVAVWAEAEGWYDGDADRLDYSYLSTSPFTHYGSEAERDRVERLQRLFGLAVEFPEVRRLLPWLIRLPWPRVHDALFRVWYERGFNARIHMNR